MAKRVGIVGAAITPFKSRWYQKTYYELAQMATRRQSPTPLFPLRMLILYSTEYTTTSSKEPAFRRVRCRA